MIANSSRRRRTLFCRGNRKKSRQGGKERPGGSFPRAGGYLIVRTGGDARTGLARIFARVGPQMGNLANFANPDAKPLESRFQGIWQNFRMPSADAKPLEMLLPMKC